MPEQTARPMPLNCLLETQSDGRLNVPETLSNVHEVVSFLSHMHANSSGVLGSDNVGGLVLILDMAADAIKACTPAGFLQGD